MKKLAAALLVVTLAVPLGGCPQRFNPLASIANPVSSSSLYEAELVFDGALKTFNELKALCAARVLPRSCRTYVVQGQGYIRQAYAADRAARDFVLNNPTLDATNVVQAFTGIVASFKATVDTLSTTKG